MKRKVKEKKEHKEKERNEENKKKKRKKKGLKNAADEEMAESINKVRQWTYLHNAPDKPRK